MCGNDDKNKIINIRKPKPHSKFSAEPDNEGYHIEATVVCQGCFYSFETQLELGEIRDIYCPNCKTYKAIPRYSPVPDGSILYCANCECEAFYIREDNYVQCYNCGNMFRNEF